MNEKYRKTPLTPDASEAEEAARIRERLAQLVAEREVLEARLAELDTEAPAGKDARSGGVNDRPPAAEKIALFRSLFRGRDDVYPRRWENPCTRRAGYAPVCENEWKPRLCEKPKVRCGACPNQAFRLVTDESINSRLRGRETLDVYPMLSDGACWFLAVDFDKAICRSDAGAFLAACSSKGVPTALERSRSGNGGHVWTFFTEPVLTPLVRRLGLHLLTEAMENNPDIGFCSYDRLFPSQKPVGLGLARGMKRRHGRDFRGSRSSIWFGRSCAALVYPCSHSTPKVRGNPASPRAGARSAKTRISATFACTTCARPQLSEHGGRESAPVWQAARAPLASDHGELHWPGRQPSCRNSGAG